MSSPRIALLAALLLILPWCSLITNDTSPQSTTTGMMISGDTLSWSVMTGDAVLTGSLSWDISDMASWNNALSTGESITNESWVVSTGNSANNNNSDLLIKIPNTNGWFDIYVKPYDFRLTINLENQSLDTNQQKEVTKSCIESSNLIGNVLTIWEDQTATIFPLKWRSLLSAIKEDILKDHPKCVIKDNNWTFMLDAPIDYNLYDDMWKLADAIAQYCPIQYRLLWGVSNFQKVNKDYYWFFVLWQAASCWDRASTIR